MVKYVDWLGDIYSNKKTFMKKNGEVGYFGIFILKNMDLRLVMN